MHISAFDIFSIGIGPSSSHTVGPMRAAYAFIQSLLPEKLTQTIRIQVELYGSLSLTGKGHGSDKAVINGLAGSLPETIEPNDAISLMKQVIDTKNLTLNQQHPISFCYETDIIFHQTELLPKHANGMRFTAFDKDQTIIEKQIYYSIGGGFIVTDYDFGQPPEQHTDYPFPFSTCNELLALCHQQKLGIAELMLENEKAWLSENIIYDKLQQLYHVIVDSIHRGCQHDGILPGGLNVKRRAPGLYHKLTAKAGQRSMLEKSDLLNYLNMYAMAVNEENAAGGRIVTAPTNGAAGIIPAVMYYYEQFHPNASIEGIRTLLLTAAAFGILCKKGASISGAEVGCQGEVGSASAMAAAGLCAVLGGNLSQIENAAEIAMEHHLGMTCDPIKGLVQIPCIERNAMGAVKSVNAARLALMGDGDHKVSFDDVLATMKETGLNMMSIYKETAQGGLAVNVTEC